MNKPELISPAGDPEKLKIAFMYGADAVYASTPNFSMRTREIGFTQESLKEGIEYAHSIGKKVYLTLNTFPHSSEIEALKEHALDTIKLNPDAIIVADPGVLQFVKENTDIPIHLSTQANTVNHLSANFWHKQGVNRIVLARELSLSDIKIISSDINRQPLTANCQPLQLEAFVHGAMCMAYSGRCQISNYLLARDPNKGACAQPCRFEYKMYGIEEKLRPGEIFPIEEDQNGAYILNSKDLNMIRFIPELIDAGIGSFKIEGRLKSIYYVALVTIAYRQAIDLYFDKPDQYHAKKDEFFDELSTTGNREYTTGFYFGKPNEETNNYATSRAKSDYNFAGIMTGKNESNGKYIIEMRNQVKLNDNIEAITPDKIFKFKLTNMTKSGENIEVANPNYIIETKIDHDLPINTLLRSKK